jgi:ligand-binding SRPBCC domain-containing protein
MAVTARIKNKIPVDAIVHNQMYGDTPGKVIMVNMNFKDRQWEYRVDFGKYGVHTMTRDQLHYNPPVESE